jgi:peptidyl-Lys metalloendopeptidase
MNARLGTNVVMVFCFLAMFAMAARTRETEARGVSALLSQPEFASRADDEQVERSGHHCLKCRAMAAHNHDDAEAKIDVGYSGSLSCDPPEQDKNGVELASFRELPISPFPILGPEDGARKRIAVSHLVEKALNDQIVLLRNKRTELERWDRKTQIHFAKWFGTTSDSARQLILKRIAVLSLLNERYSVTNFRRAFPPKPGLFAYVHPQDPTKVFVDMAFVKAPPVGENSRAGTITHEMSHFILAGGTKDFAYGPSNCKALARTAAEKALFNADNFEYFVESVQ